MEKAAPVACVQCRQVVPVGEKTCPEEGVSIYRIQNKRCNSLDNQGLACFAHFHVLFQLLKSHAGSLTK